MTGSRNIEILMCCMYAIWNGFELADRITDYQVCVRKGYSLTVQHTMVRREHFRMSFSQYSCPPFQHTRHGGPKVNEFWFITVQPSVPLMSYLSNLSMNKAHPRPKDTASVTECNNLSLLLYQSRESMHE